VSQEPVSQNRGVDGQLGNVELNAVATEAFRPTEFIWRDEVTGLHSLEK